jgi:hypothetical protein
MLVGLVLFFEPPLNGALVAAVDNDGDARGHGAIQIRDGVSNTIHVADGTAQASCADADGDGAGGLVRLTIGLRDIRTGEAFTGIIAPLDGDIDETGRFKTRISFNGGESNARVFDVWLQARFHQQSR